MVIPIKKIKTLFFLLIIFLFSAHAIEITVVDPDDEISDAFIDYIKKEKFNPGDEFILANGKRYKLEKKLGSGSTTNVLGVKEVVNGNSYALRIPKISGENQLELAVHYINSFKRGHLRLKRLNVPIPDLYDFHRDAYVLVEKLNPAFNLHDFYFRPERFSSENISLAEEALYGFVVDTSHLKHIGDFKAEQVLFDRVSKQWILADWTDGVRIAVHQEDNVLFSDDFFKDVLVGGNYANSRRERIISHIQAVIKTKREDIANLDDYEMRYLDDLMDNIKQKMTPKEIKEFYSSLDGVHLSVFYNKIQKYFFRHHLSVLLENDVSLKVLSEYQNLLFFKDWDSRFELIERVFHKVESFQDLHYLIYVTGNEKMWDGSNRYRFYSLVDDNLDRLIEGSFKKPFPDSVFDELTNFRSLLSPKTVVKLRDTFFSSSMKEECTDLFKKFFNKDLI